MSEVAISYKGNTIGTMDASGTKTLKTGGKYCEADISVVYDKPDAGYITQDEQGYLCLPVHNSLDIPIVTANTTDITDGVTALATGDLYLVYSV